MIQHVKFIQKVHFQKTVYIILRAKISLELKRQSEKKVDIIYPLSFKPICNFSQFCAVNHFAEVDVTNFQMMDISYWYMTFHIRWTQQGPLTPMTHTSSRSNDVFLYSPSLVVQQSRITLGLCDWMPEMRCWPWTIYKHALKLMQRSFINMFK